MNQITERSFNKTKYSHSKKNRRKKIKPKDENKLLRDLKKLAKEKKGAEEIRSGTVITVDQQKMLKKVLESSGETRDLYVRLLKKIKRSSCSQKSEKKFFKSSGEIVIQGIKAYKSVAQKGVQFENRQIVGELLGYTNKGLAKLKYKDQEWYCEEGGNLFKYQNDGKRYVFLRKCHIEI